MEKKYEVEYRAFLKQEIFEDLLLKAGTDGSNNFTGPLEIRDLYFCPKDIKSFQEIEMNKVGSYSLRLRKEIKKGIENVTLNTKIIKKESDHNAWLEHETSVSSFKETKNILKAIGFKVFFEFNKKRYSFLDQGIHVCLEDIENLQPAIELEIMSTSKQTEKAKQTLLNYFERNKIPKESIVEKSITNLVMKERSVF